MLKKNFHRTHRAGVWFIVARFALFFIFIAKPFILKFLIYLFALSATLFQTNNNITMRLSTTQRIEILMMIGYGDRVRTQHEVCVLFNNKYPEKPINQSVVSKIERKF